MPNNEGALISEVRLIKRGAPNKARVRYSSKCRAGNNS